MDSVFIDAKYQKMYLRKVSSSYQASPTVKVVYSGRDHRSWIDVIILYTETFKNESLINNKYHYQSISMSGTMIKMISNSKDQVLVFNFDNRMKGITFNYKSHKEFRLMNSTSDEIMIYSKYNLLLEFFLQLRTITGLLDRQVAFQGEAYELQLNLDCEESIACPEFKLHWNPDQLIKYKDDSHNKPQHCLKQNKIITDNIYCLNFSSNSRMLNYIYIRAPPTRVEEMLVNSLNNVGEVSWNYASSVCQDMGGCLPVIRSKSELDEFLALIVFSHFIPPKDKIFISLSTMISKVLINLFVNIGFSIIFNSIRVKPKKSNVIIISIFFSSGYS